MFMGVADYALENGGWTLPCPTPRQIAEWVSAPGPCDGVIGDIREPALRAAIRRRDCPAVHVRLHPWQEGTEDFAWVGFEERMIGAAAARFFISHGFRHFAWYDSGYPAQHERREGFTDELRRTGRQVPTILQGSAWRRPELAELLATMRRLPRPTAILTVDDEVGQRLCEAAAIDGSPRIPQDCAILGVGNDELLWISSWPPLSSIRLPTRQLGYAAARAWHALMKGEQAPPRVLLPPIDVIPRQSTAVQAVRDRHVRRALRTIHKDSTQRISVPDVVLTTGLNRRALEQRFRNALGCSILDEIHRVQIREAKRLLARENRTVGYTAARLGFASTNPLVRLFVSDTGLTPKQWQQQMSIRSPDEN